jgi:hypothetical protein
VTLSGTASDSGTGLHRVEVNTGAAWKPASGTTNWSYAWPLPLIDDAPSVLKVRSIDVAGNESLWAQVDVTVDTVAPVSSAPVPRQSPWVTSTVIYDWPQPTDGSGILRSQIHITSTGGYDAVFNAADSTYTFAQATQESKSYYARVRAQDGRGNWGNWSDRSDLVLPDLTPPTVDQPSVVVDSGYLHAVSTTLYYASTMVFPQPFEVRGYAEDVPSSVARVCFTPAFGDQPPCDTQGFQPWRSGTSGYAVDPGATASGEIAATVYDEAGNTTTQAFTYELDDTPPESSASSQPYATTSPIRVAWTATDAQSGVYELDLWYKYQSGAWKYWQTRLAEEGSFEFVPSDGPGRYSFVTVARDHLGNQESRVTVADTQTVYDTDKPTSAVTWAPAYWNKSGTPITMTWAATPTLAPLVEVRLWVRYNGGDWTATTVSIAGRYENPISGLFSFDPQQATGRYDFDTVARDEKDFSEADPYNSGDQTTWYDTTIGSPTNLRGIPAGWSRDNAFSVRWENPEDLTGIAAAYYRVGTAPQSLRQGTRVEGADLAQIDGIELPAQGVHTVWVWLEDRAGNIDHNSAQATSCKYDGSVGAPSGLASTPAGWAKTDGFAVTWTNPPERSGIAGAYWKLDSVPTGPEDGTWKAGPDLERIGGISVGGEGSHTLYLWLRDTAGNVGYANRRTTTLSYDPTPPTDVSISAPVSTSVMSFVVHWSANAAASGLLGYTVEYSGGLVSEWQPWLPSTTGTSGLFRAPLAGTEYDLRVTAYDRAGHTTQGQTRVYVEPQRAYMPVLSSRWRDWYRYDAYEPNDFLRDAYGPLISGTTYESFIWNADDLEDLYYFVPDTTQWVEVWLTNIPASTDYELEVWYVDGSGQLRKKAWSYGYGSTEAVGFTPDPRTQYYVRVYPRPGSYSTQPYRLKVTYD